MNIFIKVIKCCVFLFTIVGSSQNIEDYLRIAAKNNPKLKSDYADFNASMQRVSQVGALPDPKISFGYFVRPIETRLGPQVARISLSQMFPWFGTLKKKKIISAKIAEAKYQTFINSRNYLFFQVKKVYYSIYEVEKHLYLQRENLKILELYKRISTSKFSNTKGTMTDVVRIQISIDDLKTKIELLSDKIYPLQISFNKLLNRPSESEVIVSDINNPIIYKADYRRDSLLVESPLLNRIKLKIEAAKTEKQLAVKNGLPQFGLGLDYVFVGQLPNVNTTAHDALMPMFSMSIPLFRKKYHALSEEMKFSEQKLSYEKENLANQLLSKYEMLLNNYKKQEKLVHLYNNQIKNTQIIINLLYTSYNNLGKDFEELLRMQRELLDYETNKVSAIKNFYTLAAALDYLTSK